MDFMILPYDRLPEFIRENENLRQTLLRSGGIMKYMAEHIDDPTGDDSPLLFAQYQNYVAENYRRANRWNPNRQTWSSEDLRQRALNGNNHLWYEFQSRRVLMRTLPMQTDVSFTVRNELDILSQKYLDYAWMEDLRRRRPDIDTDLGTYKYVMEQFERVGWPMMFNGLACRSIDFALKKHHGYELTETDIYDSFNIDMFHVHFCGSTIEGSLKRGIKDLLHGKNAKACRKEAISMLKKVQWFSQHIYNDKFEDVLNNSFTIEDKKWLRSLLEHYDRDSFSEEELNFFYFGMLLADVGRLWYRMLRRYADIDLSELEKEANSFVNTDFSVNQDTWEDEEDIFENNTSFKVPISYTEYDEQNEQLTIVEKEVDLSKTIDQLAKLTVDKHMNENTASDEDINEIFDNDDERFAEEENTALSTTDNHSGVSELIHSIATSAQTVNTIDEAWDDTYDFIFDEKVKPQEIKRALADISRPKKISKIRFYYVSCRILEILNYLKEDTLRTDFMRWINLHFNCGWPDDKKHKRRFSFSLEDSSKNLETQHPSLWNEKTIKGGSGIYHHQLAIKLKNTFTQTIINGKAIDDSNSFEHLIDRGQYLRSAIYLRDNKYYIPKEAYINNGE